MRWIILVLSLLAAIFSPALGAFGIMVFIFLSVLRKPKTIPTGYHYRFDSATNGPRLVRDQPPEE